jgi:hypothetical protein
MSNIISISPFLRPRPASRKELINQIKALSWSYNIHLPLASFIKIEDEINDPSTSQRSLELTLDYLQSIAEKARVAA